MAMLSRINLLSHSHGETHRTLFCCELYGLKHLFKSPLLSRTLCTAYSQGGVKKDRLYTRNTQAKR